MVLSPYDWLNKLYMLYVAATVSIISRCGLTIDVHHRNQSNKSKLALCKPWIHFYSHLKQLYISNKTESFSSKGRCGIHVLRRLKEELVWAPD